MVPKLALKHSTTLILSLSRSFCLSVPPPPPLRVSHSLSLVCLCMWHMHLFRLRRSLSAQRWAATSQLKLACSSSGGGGCTAPPNQSSRDAISRKHNKTENVSGSPVDDVFVSLQRTPCTLPDFGRQQPEKKKSSPIFFSVQETAALKRRQTGRRRARSRSGGPAGVSLVPCANAASTLAHFDV